MSKLQKNQLPSSPLQLTPEQMVDLADRAVNILVNYHSDLANRRAWDGDFKASLDQVFAKETPEEGSSADDVFNQITENIFPNMLNLAHPKCFGFVASSPTWPSVVADFLAAGVNSNTCTWLTASGPSEIELVVIDWIKNWIGLPESAGGLLTTGSSLGSVEAFVAARESAGNPKRATVYMSDQTHHSLIRAARIIGIEPDCIRIISSDKNFALDMDELDSKLSTDIDAGFKPIFVVASAGTTATGAVDPLEKMADYCESRNLWLHIDAAYGGFACITEQGSKILRGIERADSITLDAHKWFYQPYSLGCLLVKNTDALENVFGLKPDILQDTLWGRNHPNLTNRGVELSRPFRALKLWMSVQLFGMKAFRDTVEQCLNMAQQAQDYISDSSDLEVLHQVNLSIVCFRFNPRDMDLNEQTIDKINRSILTHMFWDNNAFMSSAMLSGVFTLRVCIINYTTTWDDVLETLQAVEMFGKEQLQADDSR